MTEYAKAVKLDRNGKRILKAWMPNVPQLEVSYPVIIATKIVDVVIWKMLSSGG